MSVYRAIALAAMAGCMAVGSASMLIAWRSAPPNACRKCELGEQLEVERRTFSKICDRSRERNCLPLATTVADLPFDSPSATRPASQICNPCDIMDLAHDYP